MKKSVASFDNTTIVYEIQRKENKSWILFLHGAWSNKSVWRRWIPFFENYSWIALDYRSRGESDDGKITIENCSRDIEKILNVERINKINLIGNSYGSIVAYDFFCNNSNRVRSMVLFSIFAKPYVRYKFLLSLFSSFFSFLGIFFYKKRKKYVDYTSLQQVSTAFIWYYDLKGITLKTLSQALNNLLQYRVDLKKIEVPTLILEGSFDPFIRGKRIKKDAPPSAKFENLEGQHRLMFREPEATIQRVRKFIDDQHNYPRIE